MEKICITGKGYLSALIAALFEVSFNDERIECILDELAELLQKNNDALVVIDGLLDFVSIRQPERSGDIWTDEDEIAEIEQEIIRKNESN